MNSLSVLNRLNIRTNNVVFAVADTSEVVMGAPDPARMATRLFQDVLNVNMSFDDDVYARICAKYMVQEVVSMNGQLTDDDILDIKDEAVDYATKFCDNPANSYLWSQPDSDTQINKQINTVQVVKDVDIKVEVKQNGKIKKGGKQVLANQMYLQYMVESEQPITKKEFIELLMSELDMSKLGATTYEYNARKAHEAGTLK